MKFKELAAWAFDASAVAARTMLGRRPKGGYDAKHRVQGIGIQRRVEPTMDASTVRIPRDVVQVLASLRAWKAGQDAGNAAEVTESAADQVADEPTTALTIDGNPVCDAGYIPEAGLGVIDCELLADHDADHSACGGDVTWPRTETAGVR